MIKMSYDELKQSHFQRSVQKLSGTPMNTPEAFRVKHIVKALQVHLNEMGERFRKDILAKYAKGGAAAEAQPSGKSAELDLPFTAIEGMEEEAKAELEKFGKREIVVKHKKIRGDYLISVASWSAAELIALEPIVADHIFPVEPEAFEESSPQ